MPVTESTLTVVLHLTSSGNLSGGTRQAALLAGALAEDGHRVVFCAPPGSPALRWAEERGATPRGVAFGSLWGQWKASRVLRRIASECGADVVHAHHTKGHNAALLATFGGAFPPVVANRGVLFSPKFPAKFRSRRTAAIVTNSAAVKGVLERQRIPGEKVRVIYNAVTVPDPADLRRRLPELRSDLGLDEGPVVGTVGSGRPEKGFQYLAEAAPTILARHPSARFVLVGGGTERLVPRLRELGIADRFVLPGHRNDAWTLMGLFDLFVLPSVDMESCPNVVLEAMGMGLPVVGSRVGGVADLVEDEVTGRIVPPGEPAAIAAAVESLLAAPEQAAELGRRGRARALAEFTWERKKERTLSVYREVLSR